MLYLIKRFEGFFVENVDRYKNNDWRNLFTMNATLCIIHN